MIARALCLLLCLLPLPACAPVEGTAGEPFAGCLLAAANRREVLRAARYAHPRLDARLLEVRFAGGQGTHGALVFRLDPEGWWGYDDTYAGSFPLGIPAVAPAPEPLEAARRLFGRTFAPPVQSARWVPVASPSAR